MLTALRSHRMNGAPHLAVGRRRFTDPTIFIMGRESPRNGRDCPNVAGSADPAHDEDKTMATKKTDDRAPPAALNSGARSLSSVLSKSAEIEQITFWIVGDTPLITHAWSQKARLEMLGKQVKAMRGGKEERKPHDDFVSSLYPMGENEYGFPVTGIKNCIMSAAHKDKGLARTSLMASLWFHAQMTRVMPAMAGAICDLPLVRIYGSDPEMREDMTKIGSGLNKVANLAFRGQFSTWAVRLKAGLNTSVVKIEQLATLIEDAGRSSGLGEWRNEKKGVFGAFHLATVEEETAWDAFRLGKGPLPVSMMAQAAE